MAATFSISVDLSELLAVGPLARAHIFSSLSGAVEAVAQAGVERWQRAGLKAPLWEGERKAYAAAVRYRMVGPYEAEIINDYKYVEDIESGRPAYDMKRMLNTSMKVRTSRKGRRYLIIPFRHNTPGKSAHASAMPAAIYADARKLSPSKITGGGTRLSGTGAWSIRSRSPAMVALRKYAWGDRLPPGLSPKLKDQHKSDPHAGMVRMATQAPGGGAHSTYLTFRVMAEGSTGWIVAPRPGLGIAKAVADSVERTASTDIPAAMQRDMAAI